MTSTEITDITMLFYKCIYLLAEAAQLPSNYGSLANKKEQHIEREVKNWEKKLGKNISQVWKVCESLRVCHFRQQVMLKRRHASWVCKMILFNQ